MALSNIRREPRREITEQVVGTVALCSVIAAAVLPVYFLAVHIKDKHPNVAWDEAIGNAMLLVIFAGIGVFLICVFQLFVHAAGEFVCAKLDSHGIQLRPKRRY